MVIMEKRRRNLKFPILGEGVEEIHIVHEASMYEILKEQFISLI